MNNRIQSLFVIAAAIALTPPTSAQGTIEQRKWESAAKDSNGNLKLGELKNGLRGEVVFADGSSPQELVAIYAGCGGALNLITFADSKGAVNLDPNLLDSTLKAKDCVVRAFLEGYQSDQKALDLSPKSEKKFGKLALRPLAPDANGFSAATDEQADRGARKNYAKALDAAAQGDWSSAIAALQKAVAAYPDYSSAWLALGTLQLNRGAKSSAEKSLLEAVRADPKFALPLIPLADLESLHGDWRATLAHSQKAIDLNPAAFPDAYALNAMANVSLQNGDAAEKSAREGLRLDTQHQYPELEYSLGAVLFSKNDMDGAKQHLQAYLNELPNGPNAAVASGELSQIKKSGETLNVKEEVAASPVVTPPIGSGPAMSALQAQNTGMLVKTPAHTCLESISRVQIDNRGRAHDNDLMRVEVAISDDKEIYGRAGGKSFWGEGLSSMLGNTFSTTGLFSSIGRAVISGTAAEVAFAGEETLHGEAVFRYNFHVSPSAAGWTIHYGKESGQAAEEGWFLVDKASLTLRRVDVRAADVPRNLKLRGLEAVIDYEPETIGERRVLLPDVAEVHVKESAGTERLSRMFFDHCRSFGAESEMIFDVDASPQPAAKGTGKLELPPDIVVAISLTSTVSLAKSVDHDVLRATVAEPVVSHGKVIIPSGAALEGHMRARRGENAVVIELDRVQTAGGWVPFYARLVSLASTSQARVEQQESQKKAALADPEIPGVTKVYFTNEASEMAEGTRMVWKTESLVAPSMAATPQLNTSMGLR